MKAAQKVEFSQHFSIGCYLYLGPAFKDDNKTELNYFDTDIVQQQHYTDPSIDLRFVSEILLGYRGVITIQIYLRLYLITSFHNINVI